MEIGSICHCHCVVPGIGEYLWRGKPSRDVTVCPRQSLIGSSITCVPVSVFQTPIDTLCCLIALPENSNSAPLPAGSAYSHCKNVLLAAVRKRYYQNKGSLWNTFQSESEHKWIKHGYYCFQASLCESCHFSWRFLGKEKKNLSFKICGSLWGYMEFWQGITDHEF